MCSRIHMCYQEQRASIAALCMEVELETAQERVAQLKGYKAQLSAQLADAETQRRSLTHKAEVRFRRVCLVPQYGTSAPTMPLVTNSVAQDKTGCHHLTEQQSCGRRLRRRWLQKRRS